MARNFCLLIALTAGLFGSEEFILWAKISTKNQILVYENLAISKAMVLSQDSGEYLCELNATKRQNQTSIEFLNLHKDEIFECFAGQKFKVEDHFFQSEQSVRTSTFLTLLPIRFWVEFKSNSAIISAFKTKSNK